MEPNDLNLIASSKMHGVHNAEPRRSSIERRRVKRFLLTIAGFTCLYAMGAPEPAQAISWSWVPSVIKFQNPYRGQDVTRYPGFECKIRNGFGDCVAYSYVNTNSPDNHPEGGKPKNYYRRVSSYGWNPLNFSDCQLDDYKRDTAPRTGYQICDYGEPDF